MKPILSFLIILFILTLLLSIMWIFNLLDYQSPQTHLIYFDRGTSLRQMSQELEKQEVIPNALFFELFTRLQKKGKLLKAGEYEFAEGIKTAAVLKMMVEGKNKLYPLTIPEGFNLGQIGKAVISRGIATTDEWDKLVREKTLIESLDIESETLEGYLFPDTYLTEKRTTGEQLITNMLQLFKKKITEDQIKKADEAELSLHKWVTLASIIEKETGVAKERPLIAAVFSNRLNKNMPLQSDPTVIYGIKDFDGNLTRKHLETDTPYNTYTRPGLPPGPICSPGLESLMAVLNPENSDYLYFVGKGDGSHHFSKTLEEHNQAVAHYQLKRGNPPPPQEIAKPEETQNKEQP